jgi:hypothetical protein
VLIVGAIAWGIAAWSHPAVAMANSTVDSVLFNLINQDRANAGLAPLRWSSTLGGIAESAPYGGCGFTVDGRAQDMLLRDYFSHTILNCGSQTVFNMMTADGVPLSHAGENISWVSGVTSAAAVAQYLNTSFMNSSEHRANILSTAYTEVGVGTAQTAPGAVWRAGCSTCSNVTIGIEDFAAGNNATVAPPSSHHNPAPAPQPRPASVHQAAAAPAAPAPPPAPPAAAPAADPTLTASLLRVHELDELRAVDTSAATPVYPTPGRPGPQPWVTVGLVLVVACGLVAWRLLVRAATWPRPDSLLRRGSG